MLLSWFAMWCLLPTCTVLCSWITSLLHSLLFYINNKYWYACKSYSIYYYVCRLVLLISKVCKYTTLQYASAAYTIYSLYTYYDQSCTITFKCVNYSHWWYISKVGGIACMCCLPAFQALAALAGCYWDHCTTKMAPNCKGTQAHRRQSIWTTYHASSIGIIPKKRPIVPVNVLPWW